MAETTTGTKPKAAKPEAAAAAPPHLGAPQVAGVPILQGDLTELQVGIEDAAAQGTLVTATQKVPFVSATLNPRQERKTLEERGTVLADTDDVVTQQGAELEITEELNTETILAALLCSLEHVDPAAMVANMPRTWEFTPSVVLPSTLDTATWEFGLTDGVGTHYRGRFGFARCTALSIQASDETAQLTTTWMGRADQTLAAPASLTPPARFVVPSALFSVTVDDTWAALGTTAFGRVRSLTLDVDPGIEAAYALAGRADLDVTHWRRGRIRGGLSLVVDHDADASGELGHWKAGDLRFVRLAASNGATGADLRAITIDVAMRYIDTPDVLAVDGAQHTLDLNGMLRADSSNNILRVQIENGLAAVA